MPTMAATRTVRCRTVARLTSVHRPRAIWTVAILCGVTLHSAFVGPADPKVREGIVPTRQPKDKAGDKGQGVLFDGAHIASGRPDTAASVGQRPHGLLMFLATFGLAGAAAKKATHTPRASSGIAGSTAGGLGVGMLDNGDLTKWLPRISLFLMAVCCSTNFTLVKLLEEGHSESAVAAVRFSVALLPFLPLIPKHMDKVSIASGVEIGLWCTLGYVTQALGLPDVEASKGAFLTSLAMVVVPIAKSAFGYRVSAQIWAAVVLAMAGTALLVGLGSGSAVSFGTGELLCTTTAVGFGLMFARMDEHAKHPQFNAMGCTTWQVVTLAVSMAAWSCWTQGAAGTLEEAASILADGPEAWATLAWVGFVTTAGVLYIETWAMEEVDGAEAGVIFASEPVWASFFAAAVLHESFGPREAAGGACIILACLLTQLPWGPKAAEEAA